MCKIISIGKNMVTVVDDDDYAQVSKYNWQLDRGYAKVSIHLGRSKKWKPGSYKYEYKRIYLHRLIMNAPDGVEVDHINGNRLDNRKSNLRLCSRKENSANCRARKSKSYSKYKGVSKAKRSLGWTAQIMVDGKSIYLGTHPSEEAAALAYNLAAKKHFGEFARLNEVLHE